MMDLNTRSLTTGKDLYYVALSCARYDVKIYTNSRKWHQASRYQLSR